MHLLLTRPIDDATRLGPHFERRGHRVSIEPMLTIVPVPFDLPQVKFAAAILTSRHGARAIANDPRLYEITAIPAYCVGPATADAARETGFGGIITGDGEASALAARIAASVPSDAGPLLHLRGRHSRFGLAEVLGDVGHAVHETVVYEARASEALSAGTAANLAAGKIDGVLFFSPRTVQTFCDVVEKANVGSGLSGKIAFCLSQAVADELSIPGMRVEIAPEPSTEQMIALVAECAEAG